MTCEYCENNCHYKCDCWTIIRLIKPLSWCNIIKDDRCIKCRCHKDKHKREKHYYKTIKEERSLSRESKKKIDNDI